MFFSYIDLHKKIVLRQFQCYYHDFGPIWLTLAQIQNAYVEHDRYFYIFRPVFRSVKLQLQRPLSAQIIGIPLPEFDSSEALEKAREAAELAEEFAQESKDSAHFAETYALRSADFSAEAVIKGHSVEPHITASSTETQKAQDHATVATTTKILVLLGSEIATCEAEKNICMGKVNETRDFISETEQAARDTNSATTPVIARYEANKATVAAGKAEDLLPDVTSCLSDVIEMLSDLETNAENVVLQIESDVTNANVALEKARQENQIALAECMTAEAILTEARGQFSQAEIELSKAEKAVQDIKLQVKITEVALELSDNDPEVKDAVEIAKLALEVAEKFADDAKTSVEKAETELENAQQILDAKKELIDDGAETTKGTETFIDAATSNLESEQEYFDNEALPFINKGISDFTNLKKRIENEVEGARNLADTAQEFADEMTTPVTPSMVVTGPQPGPVDFRVDYTYLLTSVNVTWGASLGWFDPSKTSLEIWTETGPSSCPPDSKCSVTSFALDTPGYYVIEDMNPGQGNKRFSNRFIIVTSLDNDYA